MLANCPQFLTINLKFVSCAQECIFLMSARVSNEYVVAKISVDTAENEPCKNCPLSVYRSLRLIELAEVLPHRQYIKIADSVKHGHCQVYCQNTIRGECTVPLFVSQRSRSAALPLAATPQKVLQSEYQLAHLAGLDVTEMSNATPIGKYACGLFTS